MTITVYSSLDTGAPTLPSTAGQRFIDNLKLIFTACLVTGYGAKPAAGWTVGHDHADGFSLSNGEGYINFVNVTANAVAIYLMETLTSGSAALGVGDNRRSGPWFEGQSDTGRHYHSTSYFTSTTGNKHWCLVADNRTAIFQWFGSQLNVDMGTSYGGLLYFGAYLPAFGGSGFCALGGSTGSGGTVQLFPPNSGASGTALRNPFDGTVVQGASPGYRGGAVVETSNATMVSKTRLSPAVLRPVRATLMGRGLGLSGSTSSSLDAHCGLLRGVLSEPSMSDALLSKVLPALGISSPVWQDKLRPLTLPNGKQWVPAYYAAADLGTFISLDPADWE
ncbi:hypothetical protein E0E54_00740 [Azotobacter chroococcum]|uniref:hypothetical protein n=1 Tax=Azotobacter chroococcum TaxID=353 RepID=UPI00103AACEF|nr:hypothetical protein [Azotobacter chroococcum]TBW40137.1 hypothetical protein E0E54_00740 [Azotobacter chroococcum]